MISFGVSAFTAIIYTSTCFLVVLIGFGACSPSRAKTHVADIHLSFCSAESGAPQDLLHEIQRCGSLILGDDVILPSYAPWSPICIAPQNASVLCGRISAIYLEDGLEGLIRNRTTAPHMSPHIMGSWITTFEAARGKDPVVIVQDIVTREDVIENDFTGLFRLWYTTIPWYSELVHGAVWAAVSLAMPRNASSMMELAYQLCKGSSVARRVRCMHGIGHGAMLVAMDQQLTVPLQTCELRTAFTVELDVPHISHALSLCGTLQMCATGVLHSTAELVIYRANWLWPCDALDASLFELCLFLILPLSYQSYPRRERLSCGVLERTPFERACIYWLSYFFFPAFDNFFHQPHKLTHRGEWTTLPCLGGRIVTNVDVPTREAWTRLKNDVKGTSSLAAWCLPWERDGEASCLALVHACIQASMASATMTLRLNGIATGDRSPNPMSLLHKQHTCDFLLTVKLCGLPPQQHNLFEECVEPSFQAPAAPELRKH